MNAAYTKPFREYFAAHAIDEEICTFLGVWGSGRKLSFPYNDGERTFERTKDVLNGNVHAAGGSKAIPWTPVGTDGIPFILEGEPDCLAAISLLYEIVEIDETDHYGRPKRELRRRKDLPPPLADLTPIALPGAGVAHAKIVDIAKASGHAVLCLDGDTPGRAATEKLAKKLQKNGITVAIAPMSDDQDFSDVVVAVDDPIEVVANLVAEALAAAEEVPAEEADAAQVEEDAPDPLPPAIIAGLLDGVLAFVDRYVVLPGDHERFAQALWVAHTYAFDGAHATPYMLVLSAEKRSGKTRDLEALGLLVSNPWPVIGASEAAIFRKIDRDRPTMLLDEVDALWGSNTERTEPLRAVLNAGNRPGAAVARCTGEGGTNVEDFSVYCPKALFGIDNGRIPDTQRDRSIVIRMVRKTSAEPVERFRHRIADKEAQPLRKELAGWAAGAAVDLLLQAEPDLPLDLDDRAAEAWEPLLAIADMAGGDWPAKARAAALALSGDVERDDVTTGTLLLGAIRDAFGESDRMTTVELLAKINADEELPFGGWSDGNGLDGRRLAKLLKPYKVKPRPVRIDDEVAKGYLRSQLEEVWERWLPHPAGTVTSVTSVTDYGGVTHDPALEAGCNPVTDVTAETDRGGGVTDLEAEAERVAEKFGVAI